MKKPKPSLTEGEVLQLVKSESQQLQRYKEQLDQKDKVQGGKSSLFTSQSRDEWYSTKVRLMQANKDKIPPCGWYDVNYSLLDK